MNARDTFPVMMQSKGKVGFINDGIQSGVAEREKQKLRGILGSSQAPKLDGWWRQYAEKAGCSTEI